MENEHQHITSVIRNLKSWKFVRNMMINNIQLKFTKLLSFKNIGKGLISIALITSLLTSPFSIYADNDESIYDFTAYEYWYQLGFNELSYSETISVPNHTINVQAHNNTFTLSDGSSFSGFYCDYNTTSKDYTCRLRGGNTTAGDTTILYEHNNAYNMTSYSYNITQTHSGALSYITNNSAYPTISNYNRAYSIYRSPNDTNDIILAFITHGIHIHNNPYSVYSRDGESYTIHEDYRYIVGKNPNEGGVIYSIRIHPSGNNSGDDFITPRFPAMEGKIGLKITPIYLGTYITMPDDIRTLLGYDTDTENLLTQIWFNNDLLNQQILDANLDSAEYLYDIRTDTGRILNLMVNGNSSSQSTSTNLNNVSNDLADQVQNLNDVNQSLENDMSSSLNNLDTNSLLMQSQQFTKGMSWLKARFNTMFLNNPFGWYIQISLIIGIAMFMIGRYRK